MMKRLLSIVIFTLYICLQSVNLFAESYSTDPRCESKVKLREGGINTNQPISVGQVIYHRKLILQEASTIEPHTIEISYLYSGIENGGIKIQYEKIGKDMFSRDSDPSYKSVIRKLHLDSNKQATLMTDEICYGIYEDHDWVPGVYSSSTLSSCSDGPNEFTITVVDDQNRITVTELKETPPKVKERFK